MKLRPLTAAAFAHAAVTPSAVPAALVSPLCATIGIVLYERWQGNAVNLNLWKCGFCASLFAMVVFASGTAAAATAVLTPHSTRMLLLSAFLGIVIGDTLWLQALSLLGARLTILMTTLQPLLAALAGIVFLDQPLPRVAALGILAVCSGLALAQSTPPPPPPDGRTLDPAEALVVTAEENWEEPGAPLVGGDAPAASRPNRQLNSKLVLGAALNLLNMAFDTAGSVLTRRYGVGLSTWHINAVRFGSAAAMTLVGMLATKVWFAIARPGVAKPAWSALAPCSQPLGIWLKVAAGALLVTFLSPALGNYALFGLPLGIWSALNSLGPIWSVPILFILRGETTSSRGLVGAGFAVAVDKGQSNRLP